MNQRSLLLLIAIVALTVASYGPAITAGFIWDDDDYVTENPLLHDSDGLRRIWTTTETPQYYPLVFTTFWVEHHLWGINPVGYHLVNILLHALNAFLLGQILWTLGLRGAWWVALLFAVHPVHVESVAWITERKNVLSALFYLLAFLAYLDFARSGRRRFYVLALLAFLAAMLSKTVAASFPFVLGLALLASNDPAVRRLALAATVFYIAHHILVKTNLFLIGGVIRRLKGTEELREMERQIEEISKEVVRMMEQAGGLTSMIAIPLALLLGVSAGIEGMGRSAKVDSKAPVSAIMTGQLPGSSPGTWRW